MPVLVEAISVITRKKAIDEKFLSGWEGFQRIVPNSTLCFDEELVRVGFTSPEDVQAFVYKLQERGLTFLKDNKAIDITVVDQQRGVTTECEWLMFSHLNINESGDKVAACWLVQEQRMPFAGIHMPVSWQPGEKIKLATPPGWTYENSLSQNFRFVENENANKEIIFIGHENGMAAYLERTNLNNSHKLKRMKTHKEEDRCEITGLKCISCYHCQKPPEYEMKETTHEDSPVVEILYNGGRIHEFDEHFRFGKSKAGLFLACMDIVKELASTPYGEMPAIENQTIDDSVSGNPIIVKVEIKKEIRHSSGRILKIPWVRLQSGKYSNVHIGFGRKKAIAIVALRKQLVEWANYPLVDE